MVKKLTDQDLGRLADAIATAERGTSGEIFCVMAGRVSSYREVRLGWAIAAALLLPLALIPLGFDGSWLPGVADSWEAVQLASREVALGKALAAYTVVQAAVFLTVFLLTGLEPIRRWVTPRSLRRARVRKAALSQFMAHGIHLTDRRTGVLIFACAADRQVEVIADEGIHGRVPPAAWADLTGALATALKRGQPTDGFVTAVTTAGDLLARHFPPVAGDRDELPDRLVLM